jgi:hypothetical protein
VREGSSCGRTQPCWLTVCATPQVEHAACYFWVCAIQPYCIQQVPMAVLAAVQYAGCKFVDINGDGIYVVEGGQW